MDVLNRLRSHASRRNAVRGQCAAIVVRDGDILTYGFARSLVADKRVNKKPTHRTDLHAEADAVVTAAMNGVALEGATLYCTIVCCRTCFALAAGAGIKRIVTPPPPGGDQGYYRSHGRLNAEIARAHHIQVCAELPMPAYEPVCDDSFLPRIRRLTPGE